MENIELAQLIEKQRNLMVSVATGGPRIQEMNHEYIKNRATIRHELKLREIDDPNPYANLWDWYGKWSSGDLQTYQSRRIFISQLYQELIDFLNETPNMINFQQLELSGQLSELQSSIEEIKTRLITAKSEDQFKAIGLLCRELLIKLAQIVYNPNIQSIEGATKISNTDSKGMLLSYVAYELSGSSQEATRRYVKATINLANDLTHNQTADFQRGALCVQATISLVNIIGILSK